MFRTLSLAGAALAMGATALVPATPAAAQSWHHGSHYDNGRYQDRGDRYRGNRYRDDRYYRDRGYHRCSSGTTGTVVGAIAGGLLGRTIDTRGDRTVGTLGGAVVGGLAGRAIDKSGNPRYCR